MLETMKSWLKNPPPWIMLVLTLVIAIFAVIGPVSPERFNRLPAVVGLLIGFVLKYRLYIAIGLSGVVAYWMRRRIFRALIWGKEWLYVRPLVFFIRPAVLRITRQSATSSASEPLLNGGEVLDNKLLPRTLTPEGSSSDWKFMGNWEIQENDIGNWEIGPDWIRGKRTGMALWRKPLAATGKVSFEATLLENLGSDEIDVIVGDSMALYYSGGVRLDYMTDDLKRTPNIKLVPWEKPQVGRMYTFTLTIMNKMCRLKIDDKFVMDLTSGPRTIFNGRIGFHHWQNRIEFKNLRFEKTQ